MTESPNLRNWTIVGLLVVLWFAALGRVPLTLPDEGRYTLIPQEMLASGDFVTPRLDGVLYFEKPPLHYWLTALTVAAFGPDGWGARLWCALFGLGTILLTWHLGRKIGGDRAGWVAAAVLATSPLHFALSRTNTLDMTLTFFFTATLVAFWHAQGESGTRRAWLVAAASAALAVLTKGLIGFVLPGAVIFFFLLGTGRWRLLTRVPWFPALGLFLLVAAPWHVAMARRHADFLDFYFVHEHFLRYATPVAGRLQPFWYFFAVIGIGMLPWTPLVLSGLGRLLPLRARVIRQARPELVFLGVWSIFVVLFFSISKSKLSAYVLPALPPMAVLVGLLVADLGDAARAVVRRGLAIGGVLLLALGGALLAIGLDRVPKLEAITAPLPGVIALAVLSMALAVWGLVALRGAADRAGGRIFAAAVVFLTGLITAAPPILADRTSTAVAPRLLAELQPDDLVFSRKECPYDLAATIGREVDVVDYGGELDFGIGHLTAAERARRFPDLDTFRDVWGSPRTVWLVVRERFVDKLLDAGLELGPPLVGEGEYRLYRNHPRTGG